MAKILIGDAPLEVDDALLRAAETQELARAAVADHRRRSREPALTQAAIDARDLEEFARSLTFNARMARLLGEP